MSKGNERETRFHNLKLPTGTETMHLQEAARHRRITRILEDLFDIWGYSPVETPLVDYVEVYRPLLSEEGLRDTYRAVDRQGEILAVRPDTTLFLAKQLGLHLCTEELPVRVWYNDQIVRAEAEDEIARNEYQQAGLELVGVDGRDADVEVLTILQETLQALDLDDSVIHLGTHRIIASLGTPELARIVMRRRPIPDSFGLTGDEKELLRFIGNGPEFERALRNWTLRPETRAAAEELLERIALLGTTPPVRIDTSELGAYAYYTGIAFGAYHHQSTAAIVIGGRYNDLLGHFGFDAPSVGFSMYTRKLPVVTQGRPIQPSRQAPGGDFLERLQAARTAHDRGERMHL